MTKSKETKQKKKFFSQQKIFSSLYLYTETNTEMTLNRNRKKIHRNNFFLSKKLILLYPHTEEKIFFAAKNFFFCTPTQSQIFLLAKNPNFSTFSQFFAMSKHGIPGFSLFSLDYPLF